MHDESQDVILARVETKLDAVSDQLTLLTGDLVQFKRDCKEEFVNRYEFRPVRAIVFGAVGLTLTAVLLALVAMVVHAAS